MKTRRLSLGILLILALLALLGLTRGVPLYVDYLWFEALGYERVFLTRLWAQVQLGILVGLVIFLLLYGNLRWASRYRPEVVWDLLENQLAIPNREQYVPWISPLILGVSAGLALLGAVNAMGLWEPFLLFQNPVSFGVDDPIFQRDLGFYVFRLPFLETLQEWLFTTLLLALILTAAMYVFQEGIRVHSRGLAIDRHPRWHLFGLLALIFLVKAWDYALDAYLLLLSQRGVVFGAGYADIHVTLPALRVLLFLSLVGAGLSVYGALRGNWILPAGAVVGILVLSFLGQSILPDVVQRFQVVPNEIDLERPYIQYNIRLTRYGYDLDRIEEKEFPAQEDLTPEVLRANDLTIKNIRLWDHRPLLSTYRQLQQIRTYYDFVDVDNDRYVIGGELRQVMLSPRELSYDNLPSRIWINEHLTYTHGYGLTLGPVNQISPQGLPIFYIKDIPPRSSVPELRITRPEIYYGEIANEYVFVNTDALEFDYPVGDTNQYTRYEGDGGVQVGGWIRRLMLAAYFGTTKILLSQDIHQDSRVMFRRQILERIRTVAPFLLYDRDPYLVISREGRLIWLIDGYTTSFMIPYSQPTQGVGNYIRNSVKATLDAYTGRITFYVSDPKDPLIQAYSRIFPGVFRPLEEMPEDLRAHIRYPQDLFRLQAEMYGLYHMQDPQIFYNKEDLWQIPRRALAGNEVEIEPYYTIMKLPGEEREEFILMLPYTPARRDNMSAWLAARSDGEYYGHLIVFVFPKQKLIYGPRQIDARIDQDAYISQQLTLWSQRGSRVIRGSLLVIPIEESLLYVEPLYLAAEAGSLPELRRVIVSYADRVVMEETLEKALSTLFQGIPSRPPLTEALEPRPARPGREGSISRALEIFQEAQEHLRRGEWAAFGSRLQELENLLRDLAQKEGQLENRP